MLDEAVSTRAFMLSLVFTAHALALSLAYGSSYNDGVESEEQFELVGGKVEGIICPSTTRSHRMRNEQVDHKLPFKRQFRNSHERFRRARGKKQ